MLNSLIISFDLKYDDDDGNNNLYNSSIFRCKSKGIDQLVIYQILFITLLLYYK